MKPFFRDQKMKIGEIFKQLSCKITKMWLKIVRVNRDEITNPRWPPFYKKLNFSFVFGLKV